MPVLQRCVGRPEVQPCETKARQNIKNPARLNLDIVPSLRISLVTWQLPL